MPQPVPIIHPNNSTMAPSFARMKRSHTLPNKPSVTFVDEASDGRKDFPSSRMFVSNQNVTSRQQDVTSEMNGWHGDHPVQQVAPLTKQEMETFKTHVQFHGPDLSTQRFSYSNYEALKNATIQQNMKQQTNNNRFSYSNFEMLKNDENAGRRNKVVRSQTLPLNQRSPAARRMQRSMTLGCDGSPLLHHRLQRILSSQDLDGLERSSRDRDLSQSQAFDIYQQMKTVCSSSGDLTDAIKEHLDKSDTFSSTPSPERRKKKHFYDNDTTGHDGSAVPLKGSWEDEEFDVEDGIEVFIDYDPIMDRVKTPNKSKTKRSKMASNKNGSHGNGPPGGSAADSANNNVRESGKLTSQLSTETEGTLSTCSTLDRLAHGEDRHVSNSDFEDLYKANDLSDTDTLTGSPQVQSPAANGQFPSTGLNVGKMFLSPCRDEGATKRNYLEQLDELINEPLVDDTKTYDTAGLVNMDYLAQLEAPQGPPKSKGEGPNGRKEDIAARVDQDTMDLLAQLDSFGTKPARKEPGKDTGNGIDYLANFEADTMNITSVEDTIGQVNMDYLAELDGKDRHRLGGNTTGSPERSPVFPRRATSGILSKVTVFENLERRRSGLRVKDEQAIEEEFDNFQGVREFRDFEDIRAREAEERLDSLGPEEDEEERNKSVRDAINIFERFKGSLSGRPAEMVDPDPPAPKQDTRPALRPQQAFETSFDLDSSSHEREKQDKIRISKKEVWELRSKQGQKMPSSGENVNKSDRGRVKYRSSSADRFTDPNRKDGLKKRDVSPRFSPQNAGNPDEDRRRLKLRSQSGDRIRPKSEYREQEERARKGQETYVSFAQEKHRGRQPRKEERGRQKGRGDDRYDQVKSDPEIAYISDEQVSPLPPRDDVKRRSGFERHLEQPPVLSPVRETRPISGHYDNQLSPPPYDPSRRSGSYERAPGLIVSPQPGERRSMSYDRPQAGPGPYQDLKRWSGNYDRQQSGPPVPTRAMPRAPPGFERDYRIPPYREQERRDSPHFREDRGSPYMHEHGPGSPRCFSPQQHEGSPRCFSPRQWPYQDREGGGRGSPQVYSPHHRQDSYQDREGGGRGSPQVYSPHHRQDSYQDREGGGRGSPQIYSPHHRQDGFHYRPEDDPIYARVQKTNRPYYGPPEPGTYYIHDRPDQWQRSPHYDYEQRYYDNRGLPYRYPPYPSYPHDPYMRHPQEYMHREWDYQDRPPYPMNYPPPLEMCPYHHPNDPRDYHGPHSPKHDHHNQRYHDQQYTEPRSYQEPLSPKQDLKTPYDNVDGLGPLRSLPQHNRGPSPTGYHSDDPMYLRKMTDFVQREQAHLKQQALQQQKQANFYSDFHPGDPYKPEQTPKDGKPGQKPMEWKYGEDSNYQQDDPYRTAGESTEWRYGDGKHQYTEPGDEADTLTSDSAFRRYMPGDDPFEQLNPTSRPPDRMPDKMASFDSDMIPSYSDLPDQEAVQSQDLLDQYMSPPHQMKLRPSTHGKKEKHVKKVAPLAVKPDTNFDNTDTLRSTSTNASTLKSFGTDTIGSSKSWGKYDPFINPSAFAPELGMELFPKWSREDRDKTPTRSGPPPQRSLSDPSESESTKSREVKPYHRSRTSPGAVPNITVNSPSPAGDRLARGTNMNRDVWVQLEARHPRPAPPSGVSSSNLNQIEIASSAKPGTPPNGDKMSSRHYKKVDGKASEIPQQKEAPRERDILKEKGVFFSQPSEETSRLKKNFDKTRDLELSRKKLIYRKSNSDTKIPINGKAARPQTLDIQLQFPKPDEERSRLRGHRIKQLTDSALAIKCQSSHLEVRQELKQLSSSRGAKIAGLKTAMFDANGKQGVIIHPVPVKSQSVSSGGYTYCQDLAGEEYLINVTKETRTKKVPVIQDQLAELEGLFHELDLDNEHLMTNAERQEIKVNLMNQSETALASISKHVLDLATYREQEEPMPSLEYARKWLAEENERILNDAADFENMLALAGQDSDEVFVDKSSEQSSGVMKHSETSSVISDRSAPPGTDIPRRPIFPRKIADDVLTRKVARSNSSGSVPTLPPVSPISFLALHPALSSSAEMRRDRSRSKTPDPVLDDINFRKIHRSHSQPGINNHEVKAKPSPTSADYLRERTTEPVRQLSIRFLNTADMYHDDLAYRRLRKDISPNKSEVVSLRQRSRSLDNVYGPRSPALRHRRPPDGRPAAEKASDIKSRQIRKSSLSKGVANLVDLFDSSEDSGGKSVIRQSHSLPDLSGYRSELSVDFDDRGNIVSADPKYIQHARHPRKTPRSVKMRSRLRQKHSDLMDDSESGDTKSDSAPTSDGGLSGSEDASHEFEVRSRSLTSQSHDSDRSDLDLWTGKQGADRFKRSPAIEPDVFIPRKQTDEKIKNWYKSHQESFDQRLSYFESDCQDVNMAAQTRCRISLRKSASQENISGARVELHARVRPMEAEMAAALPTTLRTSYGSDPCLAEGRSRPPKHTDYLKGFRSILHFTVPAKKPAH